MAKFNVEMKSEFDIEFVEPEKSKAYFVDGDWSDYFYPADTLEELVEVMSTMLAKELESPSWDSEKSRAYLNIEGFPILVANEDRTVFETVDDDEFGKIRISNIGLLDTEWVNETE